MYIKIVSLVLCLTLFGSSLAAIGKAGVGRGGLNKPGKDRTGSSTGRGGLHNVVPGGSPGFLPGGPSQVFPGSQDTINIDDNDDNVQMKKRNAGASGDQWDDEGSGPDAEGSGLQPASLTPCTDMKHSLQMSGVTGPYDPLCTPEGLYQSRQCDRSGQCWCVRKDGTTATAKGPEADLSVDDCNRATGRLDNLSGFNKAGSETPRPVEPTDPDSDIGYSKEDELPNKIDQMGQGNVDVKTLPEKGLDGNSLESKAEDDKVQKTNSSLLMGHPGILAGIIGGAVVGLLCAVLLVMFIVYRMRKKDEGSYALDEPRKSPPVHGYRPANQKEYYA